MKALESLDAHLRDRATELQRSKAEGHRIIGYFPGGYMPEELVLASGAIPVGLHRGGEHEPVMVAGAYHPRWLDTFCRAQIGYKALTGEPFYDIIDLYVVPITENNVRGVADAWEFYKFGEVFRFGVPHRKTEQALKYFLHGINSLKNKLQDFTGVEITEQKLREAIALCNRERELFQEISLMRKSDAPPLTGRDFAKLSHASLLADKEFMVQTLEAVSAELKKQQAPPFAGPRVLLTGSTLAYGDEKILRLIEEAGGAVVVEEFAEGLRYYWETVDLDGDLMAALADYYFQKRIVPAWFRPARERHEFLMELAKVFRVDGVIWYHLMYRDAYIIESTLFPKILKEATGLSMLTVESDYDVEEIGALRTRVETFIETIKKG